MKTFRLSTNIAVIAATLIAIGGAEAQDPDPTPGTAELEGVRASELPPVPPCPVSASINYGGAQPIVPRESEGFFEQIALKPGEVISIDLSGLVTGGAAVRVEAPDGGDLLTNTFTLGSDGSGSVTFLAPTAIGNYRLLVASATGLYQLSFLVANQADENIPHAY